MVNNEQEENGISRTEKANDQRNKTEVKMTEDLNKIRKFKYSYDLGNDSESLESMFWFILSCTKSYVPHLSRGLWKPAALPNVKIMLQRHLNHEYLL